MFGSLYERVMRWSRHPHAERYLAAVSFAESSFFPVPVAVMLLPMCMANTSRVWRLALITTIASVLGGMLGYVIGHYAFEWVEPLFSSHAEQIARAREWFGVYGAWVVLMAGFSPIPYKVFTITAGALSMALLPFVLASIVGRASQFYLIAVLVHWLGPAMEPKIRQYVEWLGWGLVAIVVAGLLYLNLR
jgi:membrane protein YqaA with SNARE-associated domain